MAAKECTSCQVLGKLLKQANEHNMDLLNIIKQNNDSLMNRNKELIAALTGENTQYPESPPQPTRGPAPIWSGKRRQLEARDRAIHNKKNVQAITDQAERDAGLK